MKVDFAGQKNVSHIFFPCISSVLTDFYSGREHYWQKKSDYILNFFPLQATCIFFFPSQWQAILSTVTLLEYSFLSSFEWTLSNMVYF